MMNRARALLRLIWTYPRALLRPAGMSAQAAELRELRRRVAALESHVAALDAELAETRT